MNKSDPFAISISRQKGCGGAHLGQKIAEALGVPYLDRELLSRIAKELDAPLEFVEAHDERLPSSWESIVESIGLCGSIYNPASVHTPVFEVSRLEQEMIAKIAHETSVVIVGRGASHILRNHPKHISIFLFAGREWRVRRIQKSYGITYQDAMRQVETADVDRARFNKALSGRDMCDATQYHLALNTSVMGLYSANELLLQYVRERLADFS